MRLDMTAAEIEFETLVENVRDALYDWESWFEETLVDNRQVVQMDPSTVHIFHS